MLNISTFNIQNDFSKYDFSKSIEIMDYILKYKIDVLGLQEVYSKCSFDLEKLLQENDYLLYGSYRFFLKRLLNRFNEKVAIATNKSVRSCITYQLPFFPSALKRIVTKIVIYYNGRYVSIYNTHLDYKNDKLKAKQLKRISELISKDSNLIILMGDFNLKNNKPIFNDFVLEMQKLGIYRVAVNEKTFKNSKYSRAIDHIFLSNDFKLQKSIVVKDLKISDHYPIFICVEL